MREIKFRGKRLDNGEWVYGSLLMSEPQEKSLEPLHCFIFPLDKGYHRVIPDTVGQFTGLHDKNGREIHEGDVLLWGDDNRQNQVVFSQGSFQMQRYGGLAPLRYHNLINSEAMNAEVIGNIYDNPELLD